MENISLTISIFLCFIMTTAAAAAASTHSYEFHNERKHKKKKKKLKQCSASLNRYENKEKNVWENHENLWKFGWIGQVFTRILVKLSHENSALTCYDNFW